MKERILIFFLCLIGINAFSQKNAGIDLDEQATLKNVEFTHVPFLLLRFNPTTLFGFNNTLQYGAELAPPFGRFSFSFDYGKGTGKGNFNKDIKNTMPLNQNIEYRGEIKMYFSDWYPFYALDKKPFGRYYSIEYVKGIYDRAMDAFVGLGGNNLPSYATITGITFQETRQSVNLKFGKHFQIHKHLFLDGYIGAGLGKYNVSETVFTDEDLDPEAPVLHFGYLTNKEIRQPNTSGWYFSKTAGIRIVVPL